MFLPHYIPPSGYGGFGSPYFRSPQGKVAELRLELNSGGKKDKNHAAKKIALKKIVANMTMSNNDMVALFPDIVGCMQIPSLEIKKMLVLGIWSDRKRLLIENRCFLFLVNYARMKPEVALKALPTLEEVCILRFTVSTKAEVYLGHERFKSPSQSAGITDNVIYTCSRICRSYCTSYQKTPSRRRSIRSKNSSFLCSEIIRSRQTSCGEFRSH